MAAVPEVWKVVVRRGVEEATLRCTNARGRLIDALGDLAAPMLVADAAACCARAERAEGKLAEASRGLAAAASLMESAWIVARCGAGGAVSRAAAPGRSIDEVRNDDLRVAHALAKLHHARVRAENACSSVESSRAHLCAATLLLNHPHLPGVDSLLDVKRVSTRLHLDAARRSEEESTSLADTALLRLS